jgi:hypothetical protein
VALDDVHRPGFIARVLRARLVSAVLPLACVVYAGVALGRHRVLPAIAAAVVAWLLWRRHGRARFAAYIFFSAMAVRSVLTGAWPTLAFAALAVTAMQTPAARAAWPRLRPGRVRDARMPPP